MATLHIFNPEHDIALASNLSNFTSPHAGRQLRHDLGYIPALWASDGYVLVENVEAANTAFARLMHCQFDRFVDKRMLSKLAIDHVEPWGWDLALRSFLLRYGVEAVPSEAEIAVIRDLSHRKHAARFLKMLQRKDTVGKAWRVNSLQDVLGLVVEHRHLVVKAPWSSSGRGVRFVDTELDDYQIRWMQNVIERQTMETDTLYWDRFAGTIYTDSYIRMYSPDGFMQGYGMRSDQNAKDATILRPFNSYSVVVQDTTVFYVDSVNFIGPFLKK